MIIRESMRPKDRVVAYITRGDRLLVFRHTMYPEAGVQAPAGHPEVGEVYRDVGHPVLIPGDMGRYSYVLVGTPKAMEESWGSTCHGAGRVKSRQQAKREMKGRQIDRAAGCVARQPCGSARACWPLRRWW